MSTVTTVDPDKVRSTVSVPDSGKAPVSVKPAEIDANRERIRELTREMLLRQSKPCGFLGISTSV